MHLLGRNFFLKVPRAWEVGLVGRAGIGEQLYCVCVAHQLTGVHLISKGLHPLTKTPSPHIGPGNGCSCGFIVTDPSCKCGRAGFDFSDLLCFTWPNLLQS